jgi:hypothetical protein
MTVTQPPTRNGVDVPTLFATIDAVKAQPEAAQFRFRVRARWMSGTYGVGHNQRLLRRGNRTRARADLPGRRRSPDGACRQGKVLERLPLRLRAVDERSSHSIDLDSRHRSVTNGTIR